MSKRRPVAGIGIERIKVGCYACVVFFLVMIKNQTSIFSMKREITYKIKLLMDRCFLKGRRISLLEFLIFSSQYYSNDGATSLKWVI